MYPLSERRWGLRNHRTGIEKKNLRDECYQCFQNLKKSDRQSNGIRHQKIVEITVS